MDDLGRSRASGPSGRRRAPTAPARPRTRHLRARPHRAEQRELRLGGPAADDEPVDAERAEREDQDQRDRHVRDRAVDVLVPDLPALAERDHAEGGKRRESRECRRCDVEEVEPDGANASLRTILSRSANGWRRPWARPGSGRSAAACAPSSFRSSSVVNAIASSRMLMIRTALIAPIHQGSLKGFHLDGPGQSGRVLFGGPDGAGDQPRIDAGPELERGAVRRDREPSSPVEMPRTWASSVASSISGSGRWNWSSSTRSTAGPEKSAPVAQQARPAALGRPGDGLRRLRGVRLRRTRPARRSRSRQPGTLLGRRCRRAARAATPKRSASWRPTPARPVRAGSRRAGGAERRPSRLTEGPVALQVARPGQHQVGRPREALAPEHRDRDHRLRSLGEQSRTRGSAAASSPETIRKPGSSSLGGLAFAGRRPRLGDCAAVGRRGQVERGRHAGFVRPSPAGRRAARRRPWRPRPDQRRCSPSGGVRRADETALPRRRWSRLIEPSRPR